jgi:hypothetical protein
MSVVALTTTVFSSLMNRRASVLSAVKRIVSVQQVIPVLSWVEIAISVSLIMVSINVM